MTRGLPKWLVFTLSSSLLALAGPAAAAEPEASPSAFAAFIAEVEHDNLELLAQRFAVPIAEAQIEVAKAFPDPSLQGGLLAYDVSGQGQPTSVAVQLNLPIEGIGKRRGRIEVAESTVELTRLELVNSVRILRARAAAAYVDALRSRQVLGQKQKTLDSLERLVRLNEVRLRAGDIGEVALLQSQVEAQQFRGEVLAAQAEVEAADVILDELRGGAYQAGRPKRVEGDLRRCIRTLDLEALLSIARRDRPDLRLSRLRINAADKFLNLAKANRGIDPTLAVGWTRNLATDVEAFRQPTNDLLLATLQVPLPFSRIYRGEQKMAESLRTQSEAQARAFELRVESEVRQALSRYRAAAARVALYDNGLLTGADRVLAATLYNYQRGGATLLEVLSAQRSATEVYLAYYGALADLAHGLLNLELAAGVWSFAL